MDTEQLRDLIARDYINKDILLTDIVNTYNVSNTLIYTVVKERNLPKRGLHKHGDEIIEFLREFYPQKGPDYCAKKLNIKSKSIQDLAWRNGIKYAFPDRFDPSQFYNVQTPEVAYLLGFIWADGSVSNTYRSHRVGITCVKDDMDNLLDVFALTGDWKVTSRLRVNRRPATDIRVNSKEFCEYLCEHDYGVKSENSADKILSKIPDNLKHYWFRGLSDGDGCFYLSTKENATRYTCASSYSQDWAYFENLFKSLNITYSVLRASRLNKKSGKINSYSGIHISNIRDIVKFGDYIYQGYKPDNIGLIRKYEKYLLTVDRLRIMQENGAIFRRR